MPVYRVNNFAPLVIDLSIPINGIAFRQVEIKFAVEVTAYPFSWHGNLSFYVARYHVEIEGAYDDRNDVDSRYQTIPKVLGFAPIY